MDRPSPEDLLHAFVQHWNAGDADALAGLFTEDADFVNVVGLWWRRREDIRAAHAYGFDRIFRGSVMRVLQTRVRELGHVAVLHLLWELAGQNSQTSPDGTPDQRGGMRRGVLSITAICREGCWQGVAAHNTDRRPGAETWLADDDDGITSPVSYRGGR